MLAALLLTAAAIIPSDRDIVRECHDLVEINHLYSDDGRLVFDQIIFYDWSFGERCYTARFDVVDWRLVKSPDILPQKHHATGCYVSRWKDGDTTREVYAKAIRETWTQRDVELDEREILPKELRRGLRVKR